MIDFSSSRALITGSGRGIGLEIAFALANEGCDIVISDIDDAAMANAAEAIGNIGVGVDTLRLDVTDGEAVAQAGEDFEGPLNILVNNAGVVFGGAFLDTPMAKHRLTYRVNTEGVVNVTHAFLPRLIAAERSHLVNISSASGFTGVPYGSTYASSKWAVIGFSESIRLELKHLGHDHLGVSTICPGYVDTGMFEGAKTPTTTKMLLPEDLANLIVDAIDQSKPMVLEPFLIKLAPFLKGVLPLKATDALSDLLGVTASMKGWKGHTK